VVVIDGENDQEMLAAAGVGCAMKNARPAAKEAANVVLEVYHILYLSYSIHHICYLSSVMLNMQ
jgi:cation transport ATPase